MLTPEKIAALSAAVSDAIQDEPGLRFEVDQGKVLAGFWFESAVGRKYVCASSRGSFAEAYEAALRHRREELARAEVEAQVRAEVERRLARAA